MSNQNSEVKSVWVILALILFFPLGLFLMWFKTDWSRTVKWAVTGVLGVILVLGIIASTTSSTKNTYQGSKSQPEQPKATTLPAQSLSSVQKAQVAAIITKNTNHFKQLWQDGQTALGTTQYNDSSEASIALNDPNSNASKFGKYKQTENPANDNSMTDAFKQADELYTNNVSDESLNTWRMDMIQLSSDMGIWVNEATKWQISQVSTSELNRKVQIVEKDFETVQKDIESISQ